MRKEKQTLSARLTWKRYRVFYIMLLPIVAYFIVFSYYPVYLGVVSSFQESKLMGGGVFVGLENYQGVFSNPLYFQALVNSLIVGIGNFVVQFVAGLLLALALNEAFSRQFRSMVQSVAYLPDLFSWAIVGSMWMKILAPTGMANGVLRLLSPDSFMPIVFMAESKFARTIMILTSGWKGTGYYAVLFLAAIVSIDPSIYEAAAIDGASRLRQIREVTLNNIVPTMKVVIVLGTMGLLRNFDQIFVMQNSNIINKVRNLLFQIYTDGILKFKIGTATAAATLVLLATMLISVIIRRITRYDETYND